MADYWVNKHEKHCHWPKFEPEAACLSWAFRMKDVRLEKNVGNSEHHLRVFVMCVLPWEEKQGKIYEMSLIFLKPRVVGPALPSCFHYKSCQVGFPMSLSTLSLIRLWPCGAVNNGSRTTSQSVNLTTLCLFLKHLQFINRSPLPPGLEISLLGCTTLFSCLTLSYVHFSKCSMFSCNTTALHMPCPHFRIIHAFSVKPSY